MKSDAVLIARSQERAEMIRAAREVLTNPVVVAVIAWLVIEYAQSKTDAQGNKIFGNISGTTLETIIGASTLASQADKVAGVIGPVAKALGPLLMAGG